MDAAFYVLVNLRRARPQDGTLRMRRDGISGAETFWLTPGRHAGVPATIVSGSDVRGYVYGLLELAERVRFGADPLTALHLAQTI